MTELSAGKMPPAPSTTVGLRCGLSLASFSPMNLEDNVGDVISKARTAANVSAEDAAAAAELSVNEFSALEETGRFARRPNFQALAGKLGLHTTKLEGIANGWRPQDRDLGTWRELRQITTAGTGFKVNCYLIWDEVTREAALFDTGFEAQPIFDLIAENKLELKHLFITHTHADHVAALDPIRGRFPKVKLHSSAKSAPVDQRNRANDFIHLGSLRITNRDTPGHAEDGVTYVIGNWPDDAPSVAVVGDAIFAGSMGGAKQLAGLAKQKIRDQIFSLPPGTLICPGHGPVTTVGDEKENNPFFI
jgi:glyoxylase-like metal-dependent hydrolase (beta-lactamase superfamily II)